LSSSQGVVHDHVLGAAKASLSDIFTQVRPLAKHEAYINIENVVASATLNQKIDLNSIVRLFPGVEYRPEQFNFVVFVLLG